MSFLSSLFQRKHFQGEDLSDMRFTRVAMIIWGRKPLSQPSRSVLVTGWTVRF